MAPRQHLFALDEAFLWTTGAWPPARVRPTVNLSIGSALPRTSALSGTARKVGLQLWTDVSLVASLHRPPSPGFQICVLSPPDSTTFCCPQPWHLISWRSEKRCPQILFPGRTETTASQHPPVDLLFFAVFLRSVFHCRLAKAAVVPSAPLRMAVWVNFAVPARTVVFSSEPPDPFLRLTDTSQRRPPLRAPPQQVGSRPASTRGRQPRLRSTAALLRLGTFPIPLPLDTPPSESGEFSRLSILTLRHPLPFIALASAPDASSIFGRRTAVSRKFPPFP